MMSGKPKGRSPTDYTWIAEQNPELQNKSWRDVAAEAGAIVAKDIFDRIKVKLIDELTGDRAWLAHVIAEDYNEDDDFPAEDLDHMLSRVRGDWEDLEATKALIEVLLRHSSRLAAEMWNHRMIQRAEPREATSP